MRKRNCKKFFDTLMWTTIYMLPIFIYLIMNYAPNLGSLTADIPMSYYSIGDVMADWFGVGSDIFSTTLSQLFGYEGILPLFEDDAVFYYLSYLISINILHLFVDVILALPRFCHKFLDKFSQDEE